MQRYFINEPLKNEVNLSDETIIHHVTNVMRMKESSTFILCNEAKECAIYRLERATKDALFCVREETLKNAEKAVHITLMPALIRKERFEWMLQKATELGADAIIPLKTARTIIKLDKKAEKQKRARWQTILKEASEQSHRTDIPFIDDVFDLKTLDFTPYDLVLVPYEKSSDRSFKETLKRLNKGARVCVIIGPEGGFEASEIEYLISRGAKSVSLGTQILRAETAALFSLSAIKYETEMSEQ